jgi:hypothetical protein
MGRFLAKNVHQLAVLAVFLFSRVLLVLLQVRFDASPLNYYWQYVDPKLLREDLLRSIFYLHSQPPLFNFFLGIILKLFPSSYAAAFSLIYYGLGIVLTVCLFRLLVLLRIPKTLALILTAVFILSPAVLMYERWLFYEYPAMVLFCALSYFFCRFVARGNPWDALVAFVIASALSLTLNTFHFVWMVALVAATCILGWRSWKKVLLAGALPLAIVLGFNLKNLVVFGHFNMAPYHASGALALETVLRLPLALREELQREGKISQWSLVSPFAERLEEYNGIATLRPWGVPVLDEITKSTGAVNRHHIVFLQMADDLAHDGMYALKNYPDVIAPVKPKIKKWLFMTPDDCWGVPRYDKLDGYTKWYSLIFFGPGNAWLVVELLLPLAFSPVVLFRGLRKRTAKSYAVFWGFLAVNVAGFNLPMIFLSGYEQHRYRFRTDALSFVLVALLMMHTWRAVLHLWQNRKPTARISPQFWPPQPSLPTAAPGTGPIDLLLESFFGNPGFPGPAVPGQQGLSEPQGHLQEVRRWLETNGEAILGSRPWSFPGVITTDVGRVRFSAKEDALYIILLAQPQGRTLTIDGLVLEPNSTISMLGAPSGSLEVSQFKSALTILLPHPLPPAPAYTFKVTPLPKSASCCTPPCRPPS